MDINRNSRGLSNSYKIEERVTFALVINQILKDDEDCQHRLPINPDDDSLFGAFDDGILLSKLILKIDGSCMNDKSINK
jgi:hypothetical protein